MDKPNRKKVIQLRLPGWVIQFFRNEGRGHITRMQDVLQNYVLGQMPLPTYSEEALQDISHRLSVLEKEMENLKKGFAA
jgi:hypothetical protein